MRAVILRSLTFTPCVISALLFFCFSFTRICYCCVCVYFLLSGRVFFPFLLSSCVDLPVKIFCFVLFPFFFLACLFVFLFLSLFLFCPFFCFFVLVFSRFPYVFSFLVIHVIHFGNCIIQEQR